METRALEFSDEDRRIIRESICPSATPDEFSSLMKIAALRRLNPLLGQVHFIKRRQQFDGEWKERWRAETGIDGLRAKAEETKLYDGQDEPEFSYDKEGRLLCAKVRVWKRDIPRAFVGVAYFSEFASFTKDGRPTRMWGEKPHVMLAKCAEAQALRKAFPDELSGLYTVEESEREEQPSATVPTAPVPQIAEESQVVESIPDRAQRLIAICEKPEVTTRELTEVYETGTTLPHGVYRQDVLRAYTAALERTKAKKQQSPETQESREPGSEG